MMRYTLFAFATAALLACRPVGEPEVGSQTNWLVACESSEDCGELECLCGACSARCTSDDACSGLSGAACIASQEQGAITLCGGEAPAAGLCLPRCIMSCDEGTQCQAGVCVPERAGPPVVRIDLTTGDQALVGFGASLAYAESPIVANPDKAALYDMAFGESGLDIIRLRNRYDDGVDVDLSPEAEILAEAQQRMGRAPMLFMTSASPPAQLKASGMMTCAGDAETCTLAQRPGLGFDYAGFAEFWRTSLQDYAAAGIAPQYVSIQNDPNWIPPADRPHEACRFLPEEGFTTESVDGSQVEIHYPGYREALSAVRTAIADLPQQPRFAAPEATGLGQAGTYMGPVDAAAFDAIAIHLYDQDASTVDTEAFTAIRTLSERLGRPVLQTEMQANGLDTAVLIHHSFVHAGAVAYVQNDLVSLTPWSASISLALLTPEGFELQEPYYAFWHFAKHTDPGWLRVDVTSESSRVLGTAWMSPDESRLTVVLLNPSDEATEAALVVPSQVLTQMPRSSVARTVFGGAERARPLGELDASGIVELPAHSILTVALGAP